MRLRVAKEGVDVSDVALVESLTITQDSTEAISTAEIHLFQRFGESRYDHAFYDRNLYSWTLNEWDELLIWDQDSGAIQFGGFILAVQRTVEGPHVRLKVTASDWAILLERTLITQTWPDGTPDSTIIADALALVPGFSAGTIVTQVANLGLLEAKDTRIRDLFDTVCELTGGEWNVSYNGRVNYYRAGSIVAPFGLSDAPDGVTLQAYQLDDVSRDFSGAANRVVVLGAVAGDGEVSAVAEDIASQQRYGLLEVTIPNRSIADSVTAQLLADTEVALNAWPKPTLKVSLFTAGLGRGQSVYVEASRFGVAETLILRTLQIAIIAPDRARPAVAGHTLKYSATLGSRPPDLLYRLRRMQRRPVEKTIAPPAGVAPGSVTPGSLAEGLEVIQVVSALPPLPDPAYSDTAVVLFTAGPFGPQLYRRTGNTWTAYVQTSQLEGQLQTTQYAPGSVVSTTLADGSVVSTKIPEGAVNGPHLAAGSVSANAIAANTIAAIHMQANSVTTLALVANSVVAGKIAALAVVAGNIAADAVTAGTIAVGAIRAEDAVFALAAIQSADIKELHGGKIIAQTIDSDKLNAIEIAVGFGGGKPGRFGVYGGASTLVALVGDLGGAGLPGGTYFGIWAKLSAFGGTGYGDAPFYTDTGGNLFLRNAQLEVTSGAQFVRINNNTFDPSYNALGVNVGDGVNNAWHVGRGLAVYAGSNGGVAAIVADPSDTNAGLVRVERRSGGAPVAGTVIILEGRTGIARADGGFYVAGVPVINNASQFVGQGVLCPDFGVAASGFNPKVGGVQYFGKASATFTTADGKTVTIRGGAVVEVI